MGYQNIRIWLLRLDKFVHLTVETLLGVVGKTIDLVVHVPQLRWEVATDPSTIKVVQEKRFYPQEVSVEGGRSFDGKIL